jgi:hypothetical protein
MVTTIDSEAGREMFARAAQARKWLCTGLSAFRVADYGGRDGATRYEMVAVPSMDGVWVRGIDTPFRRDQPIDDLLSAIDAEYQLAEPCQ